MAATSSTYLPPRKSSDYTVAWLCANPAIEYAAALKMLDKWHNPPTFHNASDSNQYWFGDLNRHNVVVASTPPNKTGKVSAQKLIAPLHQSFPNLKICLFVGIGGGVPCVPEPEDPYKDVRLGDVVIGWSENTGEPAVIQYDYVRRQSKDRADLLGHVDNPKDALLSGLNNIIARKKINAPTNFAEHLKRLEGMEEDFGHPGPGTDILFDPEYKHPEGKESCDECDSDRRVQRRQRSSDKLIFHLSTILSGDTLMEDATERDRLSRKYYNAKCFDMEAAPVTGGLQCLVFRGISDYADNHRSYKWHNYAAGRAAAFAREYLIGMRVQDIRDLPSGIPERYFTASQVSWSSSGSFQSRNDSQGQLLLEEGDTQEQMDRSPEGIGSSTHSLVQAQRDRYKD